MGRAPHRRVPHGRTSHGVYLTGVHLIGVYLMGVYLTGELGCLSRSSYPYRLCTMCQSVHARGGIHTTTLSLRVSSIQNLAYRIRKRYVVSCVASTRQTRSLSNICFPTGAGELPAIWPRGSSRDEQSEQ
jgi:hypothetical protein